MISKILEAIKLFSKDTIEHGHRMFTDTFVFEDECIIVKAVADVHCIVIDKDTGKDYGTCDVIFGLSCINQSEEVDFVGYKEDFE